MKIRENALLILEILRAPPAAEAIMDAAGVRPGRNRFAAISGIAPRVPFAPLGGGSTSSAAALSGTTGAVARPPRFQQELNFRSGSHGEEEEKKEQKFMIFS